MLKALLCTGEPCEGVVGDFRRRAHVIEDADVADGALEHLLRIEAAADRILLLAEHQRPARGQGVADGGGIDTAVRQHTIDKERDGAIGAVPGHGQAVWVAIDEGLQQDGRVMARLAVDGDAQGAVAAALDQQLVGVAVDGVGEERHGR